jgi:hypothetical protein
MRALSAAEFLDVWEHGLVQPPAQRALTLLALACTETSLDELAQFSIGQRDAHLLALREQTFGPQLASITNCPVCAEQLEFHVDAADISATSKAPEASLYLTYAGYGVELRLPTSLDLASLDPTADLETNRQHLLQRCVIAAQRGGMEIAVAELPAEVETAIAQRIAEADPQANVQLALTCPKCQHAWQSTLDILSYFWTEIDAWASRLLREVHALASAYGWREAEVLALSPWRRQAYLELIEP